MSKESPTVYVIQQPKPKADGWSPDLGSALQYGQLAFVFDIGDKAFAAPGDAMRKAATRLKDFDADCDYLLWPSFGDITAAWVVVMLLTIGGDRMLRFLHWKTSREEGCGGGYYFPVELNFRAK